MIRSTHAVLFAATLVLAACGGGKPASTSAADSAAAQQHNLPSALGGAPARAQVGVDSANAAAAKRDADVDALSREASGVGSGAATP